MVDNNNYKIEQFDNEILREYDIRGIVKKNLTSNTAYTLGRSFGSIVYQESKRKKIVIGYDGRLTSPSLHKALKAGLVDSGLHVISIGICPTPMLYFAIYFFKIDAGIMITGSHNPQDYNGFKMVLDKKPFYSKRIKELKDLVNKNNLTKKNGIFEKLDILSSYVSRVLKNIKLEKKIRIGWDPGNGSAGVVLKKVLNNLKNSENFIINEQVDGNFPNHHPDPTVKGNLIQLQELVKNNKCDVGFAFDGDGDRLGIIDNNSNIIWADQYMVLLSEEISKLYKDAKIIMDVKSSKVFFDEAKKMGCDPIMYKTGHSVIKDRMKELNSPLSGEMSGHVMYQDDFFGYDDAIYVSLRFLRILSNKNMTLNEIMNFYPKTFSTPETRFEVDETRKFKIVEEIKERLSKTDLRVISIDGVRVDLKEGWWGIRASNTQNVLTVRAEALNKNILVKMKDNIEKELKLSGVNFKFSF